ncbi:CBN-GOS-28 protein [Aphelenchoides avenae]|nr:CBN-GOS-28 protein [Aphelenchus avenae]
MLENLSSEIEGLLNKLTSINTEMKDHLDTMDYGQEGKSALHHTYRRHREILRDYNTEFNRAHTNITSQLEREDLLSGGGSSADGGFALNNRSRSTELLLRENDRINSCDRLLDEQMSLASSLKENLYGQRSGLGDITVRLHQMTKKYPAINNLMQKIRMKKRKDTLILAGVIASCLIFFFLYIMH